MIDLHMNLGDLGLNLGDTGLKLSFFFYGNLVVSRAVSHFGIFFAILSQ